MTIVVQDNIVNSAFDGLDTYNVALVVGDSGVLTAKLPDRVKGVGT